MNQYDIDRSFENLSKFNGKDFLVKCGSKGSPLHESIIMGSYVLNDGIKFKNKDIRSLYVTPPISEPISEAKQFSGKSNFYYIKQHIKDYVKRHSGFIERFSGPTLINYEGEYDSERIIQRIGWEYYVSEIDDRYYLYINSSYYREVFIVGSYPDLFYLIQRSNESLLCNLIQEESMKQR